MPPIHPFSLHHRRHKHRRQHISLGGHVVLIPGVGVNLQSGMHVGVAQQALDRLTQ